MLRIDVKPELYQWAVDRAGVEPEEISARFPDYPYWVKGSKTPTINQLETFAKKTHTPVGFLFLPSPPKEDVPIPDMRTIGNTFIGHPSPDLLETIYICQERQNWYRDFARSYREDPYPFVGSMNVTDDIIGAAKRISESLGYTTEQRRSSRNRSDALRILIEQAESGGIMVMVNGVVGINNNRALKPEEFRGFALSDDLAPLVFINGSDTKAAQIFTLAHEIAHIWLGKTALTDLELTSVSQNEEERWSNSVAAEMLVPRAELEIEHQKGTDIIDESTRLSRLFNVSTLVILRRLRDIGGIGEAEFETAYRHENEMCSNQVRTAGGNFYRTHGARVSKRFARAVISSSLEGYTLHRDAMRMLGFTKNETFEQFGVQLGVI